MFSTGHLIWIGLSAVMIACGFAACRVFRPALNTVLKICLGIGAVSEAVKVLCAIRILPMVEPEILSSGGIMDLHYAPTGQYTAYLEMAHLPLELCSLMLALIVAALLVKNAVWRERLLSLMYITGLTGGLLGIPLAYITADYTTTAQYFTSPRAWEFFIYHSMIVVLSLYLGFGRDRRCSTRAWKSTMALLLALDAPTFYLNSVFSQAVYASGKPVGIVYRANFFSSYVNPLGITMAQKWQWLVYLALRIALAAAVTWALLWLSGASQRTKPGKA